jgi:hypothetical protein
MVGDKDILFSIMMASEERYDAVRVSKNACSSRGIRRPFPLNSSVEMRR